MRIRQCHAVYGAMVEAMDEQIGRVLQKLEELGIGGNTAVILMSDNGGLSTSEGSPTYRSGQSNLGPLFNRS